MKKFKSTAFELLFCTLLINDKDIKIETSDKYNNLLYELLFEFERLLIKQNLIRVFKSLCLGIIIGIVIKSLL